MWLAAGIPHIHSHDAGNRFEDRCCTFGAKCTSCLLALERHPPHFALKIQVPGWYCFQYVGLGSCCVVPSVHSLIKWTSSDDELRLSSEENSVFQVDSQCCCFSGPELLVKICIISDVSRLILVKMI